HPAARRLAIARVRGRRHGRPDLRRPPRLGRRAGEARARRPALPGRRPPGHGLALHRQPALGQELPPPLLDTPPDGGAHPPPAGHALVLRRRGFRPGLLPGPFSWGKRTLSCTPPPFGGFRGGHSMPMLAGPQSPLSPGGAAMNRFAIE